MSDGKEYIPVRGMDDDAVCEKILADSMGADEEWKPIDYSEDEPSWVHDVNLEFGE